MTRGRKPGQTQPGTYGGWLTVAKPGDVWWSTRDARNLSGDAWKAGRTVATVRFYAVAPQTLEAVALVRVEVQR